MRRRTQASSKKIVDTGEPSNQPEPTPSPLDEARIQRIVQQVLGERQGRVKPERVENPTQVPPTREERERPVPQTIQNQIEPIYRLPSQH